MRFSEASAASWRYAAAAAAAASSSDAFSLVFSSLVFSLCFSGYHHGKHIFGAGDGALDVGRTMAAGAFSALYTTPVQAPQELVKCRMQHDVGRVSVRDALARLYAQGGLRAISRQAGRREADLDVPGRCSGN